MVATEMKTDENNPKHSNYSVKQVIVMRKDLNMRKGKMVAQGAHASMKAILYQMERTTSEGWGDKGTIVHYTLTDRQQSYLMQWLEGSFAKICVSVDSEAELNEIVKKARDLGLVCSTIVDNGNTEFNGVPTKTCCAIGPWDSEELNTITGHLKLL